MLLASKYVKNVAEKVAKKLPAIPHKKTTKGSLLINTYPQKNPTHVPEH